MTSTARELARAGTWGGAAVDRLVLDYEGRFLRRRRLVTETGAAVMVDLPETVSLDPGDALLTEAGPVEIVAAPEALIRVEGPLSRLAWHIGNRHTPCEVRDDHLLIRADHVLEAMLSGLGATLSPVTQPFRPEGGAYGHGRTHGHDHGPAETQSDAPSDAHAHDHHH
ncbi:urease accessory protein UreE [Rhodobacterales bacterium HKCCE2091]|nr:urease accessory protein UreE [Rhodobacterales bacterium HKCCE2091]